MPRPHAVSLLGALLLGACAGAGPPPLASGRTPDDLAATLEIRLVDRPYEVSATSVRALNRALARQGPRHDGRVAHALTGWRLSWSYLPVREGGRCVAGEARVRLELVTRMPRWKEAAEAPGQLQGDWSLFLGRLRHHEAVHQDIAVGNGRELAGLLQGLAASDCEALRRRVAATAEAVEGRSREMHAAFDRRTRFGREPEGSEAERSGRGG